MTAESSIDRQTVGGIEESRHGKDRAALRDFVLALSIAHLTLIQAAHGLLFERDFGYFNRLPVNRASLAALLLDLAGLAVIFWFAAQCIRRINRRALWAIANVAICAATLVPLNFLRTHYWHLTGGKFVSVAKQPVVLGSLVLAVLLLFWLHRHATRVVAALYLILSPMVLFTAGKTLWWILSPPQAPPDVIAMPATTKAPGPRVVWILLDELDQRVAFDARPADVKLPELTRFSNECLHATNAFPPGGSTLYSLPALTIGREVRHAHPTGAGDLTFNGAADWSEAETVFTRARNLGYSTALVGWYHPYSRVLGHYLDHCEWFAYPPFEEERGRTVSEAALNQLCAIFSQFQQRRLHIRNIEGATSASLQFLTNSPAALTLLHLPVPHLPGIYDPERSRMTLWRYSPNREYLGNLVLADHVFGELRRAMESAGTWDKTWIILSADHWWREAPRYDGQTDHRVPFMVKAPGENQPALYGRKFNTVITYHLILSILKGELTTSVQLPEWLEAFRMDPPIAYASDGQPLN